LHYITLQFCRRHYGTIFIRLAVVASQICKICRNSPKIRVQVSSSRIKIIQGHRSWCQ